MYEFEVCCDVKRYEVIEPQLKDLWSRQKRPNALQYPSWLKLQYSIYETAEIVIAIASINGKTVCAAPLIKETTDRYMWQLRLPGRDIRLARFQLRQAEFLGDAILDPTLPPEVENFLNEMGQKFEEGPSDSEETLK